MRERGGREGGPPGVVILPTSSYCILTVTSPQGIELRKSEYSSHQGSP